MGIATKWVQFVEDRAESSESASQDLTAFAETGHVEERDLISAVNPVETETDQEVSHLADQAASTDL